jgi:serine/threonine protein kinase
VAENPASTDLPAGTLLGSYRLLATIGTGGMGNIYSAEHVRLGRRVGLKVLKPELTRRVDVVKRFFAEARAVSEVGHPNIVDIHDFVEDGSVEPPLIYMVMELLVGCDLAQRIRSVGPMEPAEVVPIAVQVANALIAVHRLNILHRDLKPENIFLVERPGAVPHVKLLDFGVATTFGDRESLGLTAPGATVGTPQYMAPEQILGAPLDERTDLYSLGVVLYDMLTNSVPFQSSQFGEVLVKHVEARPDPIVARRLAQGRGPVPRDLEDVVMRCLEKKPDHRFPNAAALREALVACVPPERLRGIPAVTQETAGAHRTTPKPRARGSSRGRRLFVIVGTSTAIALLGGAGLLWRTWGHQAKTVTQTGRDRPRAAVGDGAVALPLAVPLVDADPAARAADAAAATVLDLRRTGSSGTSAPSKRRPAAIHHVKKVHRPRSRETTVDPFAK